LETIHNLHLKSVRIVLDRHRSVNASALFISMNGLQLDYRTSLDID
jgi:hypothetical protein